jgi:hypothetical protein
MAVQPLDAPLLSRTDDALARPLPRALREARDQVRALAGDLLAIPQAGLVRPWSWIGGSEEEVRYGAFRAYELFERAAIDARRAIGSTPADSGLAASTIAPATAARWDLEGVLVSVADAVFEAEPAPGEWSIRETLGHAINSQRGYAWGSAWWLEQRYGVRDPDLPPSVAEEVFADLPEDADAAVGSPSDVRSTLEGIVDLSAERLAGLPDSDLEFGARWSGFAVPVSFRLGRMSSHLREHTIQVEKSLEMLNRTPTEPERLVRLIFAAYGSAEAVVFGQAHSAEAAEIVRQAASEARDAVADARRAAEV